jgi:anti-sigma factor RsiW
MISDTPPYRCKDVRERLDDYLDQELLPHEIQWLREHIEACRACATLCQCAYEELAEMRAVVQKETRGGLTNETRVLR